MANAALIMALFFFGALSMAGFMASYLEPDSNQKTKDELASFGGGMMFIFLIILFFTVALNR